MSDPSRTDGQRPRRWSWLLLAAALLVAAGGGYWWLSAPSATGTETAAAPAPLIEVTDVAATEAIVLRQTGFVRASDAVEVVPQVTERIVEVAPAFTVGNRVTEGEVLIRLDATSAEASYAAARARVAQAAAARNEARITLNRQQELRRENVVSEATLEDAQVALARAEADLAMAEAERSRAALTLDDTELRAPFDAIVTAETASVGQLVQAGASLGRLVSTDTVEIEMGVLQSDLAPGGGTDHVVGVPVALVDPATGGDLGEGHVAVVLPEIDARTRTVRLLVRVPRPFHSDTASVRLGELVELVLRLPVEDGPALSVRSEAVKGGDTLWQVVDGTLVRIPVEVLSYDGETVSLRAEGLTDGDRVMLSDLAAPADGLAVRTPEDAMHVAEGG
ncbi:MAG: efflux RND transporter periplasmic adaptor subunit [Pseudomonadota bacterium]